MVVYKTDLVSIPPSCLECGLALCRLPIKRNSRGGMTDEIKKVYMKKRHEDCPLMEVEDASKEEISETRA